MQQNSLKCWHSALTTKILVSSYITLSLNNDLPQDNSASNPIEWHYKLHLIRSTKANILCVSEKKLISFKWIISCWHSTKFGEREPQFESCAKLQCSYSYSCKQTVSVKKMATHRWLILQWQLNQQLRSGSESVFLPYNGTATLILVDISLKHSVFEWSNIMHA